MLLKCEIEAQSYGRLNVSKLRISKLDCCDASISPQLTITASVNKKCPNWGSILNCNYQIQMNSNCPQGRNFGSISKNMKKHAFKSSILWFQKIILVYCLPAVPKRPIPGWKWSPDWYLKLKYATFEGGFFHVFMDKKDLNFLWKIL